MESELRDDLLSDDGDELLWRELLGELFGELPDDPLDGDRLSDDRRLESELCVDGLELPLEELIAELESLLLDKSLEELDGDRDDSLTLENDLLDPKMTDDELIHWLPDKRCE